MKKIIRLTESDLRNIVKESVKKIIKESDTGNFDDFYGGEEVNQQRPQQQEIINQLLQLGVRDVTSVYERGRSGAYDSENDEDYGTVPQEMVKQFLSKSGEANLMRRGYTYQWFIEFGDSVFCSRHNFNDEDYAQENCDKYINLIKNAGFSCEAYVESIVFENGKYTMDTCLVFENNGDGEPFWMD